MRIASIAACLVLSSCMGFNIIPTTDDTASPPPDDASSDGFDGTISADAAGLGCGVDPDTQVTLCLGNATCPTLSVDPDLFPGCGFRIHNDPTVLDLECACYGQICPIGIASSCDQAAALMQDQSQYTVCIQVDEGRCTTM